MAPQIQTCNRYIHWHSAQSLVWVQTGNSGCSNADILNLQKTWRVLLFFSAPLEISFLIRMKYISCSFFNLEGNSFLTKKYDLLKHVPEEEPIFSPSQWIHKPTKQNEKNQVRGNLMMYILKDRSYVTIKMIAYE